ncbi:VWA domain-containing protein [Roseimaritima ulvae]|uniref:von Willebrand factor type A domain protein n=1 Tax=Roseimaritima ulvae TaxID=980254 RepID=A0A5B9QYL6_9BACT|nr:VWA domain-containing protein [Roseimaritima ulvae]QEG43019.1 von Willebrand factor type A domain protein [Roseimaritima ulvae]
MSRRSILLRRRGGSMVLFTFLLVIVIGMAAFAIDLARVQLVRSQLQSAVDAGALAGGLQLKRDPEDIEAARAAAEQFIQLNQVGFSGNVGSEAIDVEIGRWDSDTMQFEQTDENPYSVRVFARKEDEQYSFAQIFGQTTFSVPRQAVASVPTKPLDIIMVLDLSGSMGSEGRIEALREASPEFVATLQRADKEDFVGVMGYGVQRDEYDPDDYAYGGAVYTAAPASLYPEPSEAATDWAGVLETPLTDDYDLVLNTALSSASLQAQKYGGGTPIGAAIRDGAHYVHTNAREDIDQLMVLMSDGHANKPSDDGAGYALEMAAYAASLGVKIHTISLGDSADEWLMTEIASITGGRHFDASGSGSVLTTRLRSAYRGIANDINRTTMVQ